MWLGAAGLFFLSLLVAIADRRGALSPFRPLLHDALSPGRLMVLAFSALKQPQADTTQKGAVTQHDESHLQSEQLLRQLMIENARLRRDLKREQMSSAALTTIEPLNSLAQFDVVQASVVSSCGMPQLLRDLIVDVGRSAGITRSELVVDGTGAVLDRGTKDDIAAGDRVLTGAIVVGRIEKTAHWVSLVQPVTATGFKAQVVLLRQTAEGLHFGATGMLEGLGEKECLLTGIPHTEAVAVGDEVVSADVSGIRGPQLYFGRVTRADFLAGGQWDVRVQPAASLKDLESVGILRLKLANNKGSSQSSTANSSEGPRGRKRP
jgi:cell shape-determining protein MreC